MRVALIGYGAVAAVHARGLQKHAELLTVSGPDAQRAEAFARLHGVCRADTNLHTALEHAEIAIVCSPSPMHYRHAKEALGAGAHVLVELPACTSSAEAEDLRTLAEDRGLVLQCAHTSRYLEPYRRLTGWIAANALGDIRHVQYVRAIPPRTRSWTDDALWHHSAHILDLLLLWFHSIEPLSCAAFPAVPGAQDLSLTAKLPGGAPVALSISYTSRLPEAKLTIVGTNHTLATDGFTYITSDNPNLSWSGAEQVTYERAIQDQDIAFCDACRGHKSGIPWEQTIRLTNCIAQFADL